MKNNEDISDKVLKIVEHYQAKRAAEYEKVKEKRRMKKELEKAKKMLLDPPAVKPPAKLEETTRRNTY